MNVAMYFYPDIAQRWKIVYYAFSLSPREIDLRYDKLLTFQQHHAESFRDYCTRFEKHSRELVNLGKVINPDVQGFSVYNGLRSEY